MYVEHYPVQLEQQKYCFRECFSFGRWMNARMHWHLMELTFKDSYWNCADLASIRHYLELHLKIHQLQCQVNSLFLSEFMVGLHANFATACIVIMVSYCSASCLPESTWTKVFFRCWTSECTVVCFDFQHSHSSCEMDLDLKLFRSQIKYLSTICIQ